MHWVYAPVRGEKGQYHIAMYRKAAQQRWSISQGKSGIILISRVTLRNG